MPKLNLRRVNNVLFVLIVLINAYVISAPALPQLTYWWHAHHSTKQADLQNLLKKNVAPKKTATKQTNQPNSLIIPAMMLQSPTLEGPESNWFDLLYKGIWRWPASSTPDKGSNTVFLAHRFSYTGPRGAFYYLDKLKPGDQIGVIWNNKTYTYSVVSSTTVPPTDTAIENPTSDSRITLFTCTPLWHPVNRLVVVAELKGVSS